MPPVAVPRERRIAAFMRRTRSAAASEDELAINPIIYAEAAAAFPTQRDLDRALRDWPLHRLPLPYEAGFLAGQAFVRYRREGGQRRSPLGFSTRFHFPCRQF